MIISHTLEKQNQNGKNSKESNFQAMETVHIKTGASTGVNWKNV